VVRGKIVAVNVNLSHRSITITFREKPRLFNFSSFCARHLYGPFAEFLIDYTLRVLT
jgi:hypothetical protein